nr:MAG TPA: hypothetical protein [Caudoviricetes sp.]
MELIKLIYKATVNPIVAFLCKKHTVKFCRYKNYALLCSA